MPLHRPECRPATQLRRAEASVHFFFQAEDGIRDLTVTGVQTCALPISKETKPAPKDVVFVVDTSGSMAGAKLQQAKKALEFCVENLNGEDRFEIVRFSTEAEPLFGKLVEADSEHRKRASNFIADLKPIGGTAIADALQSALNARTEKTDRPFVIIFLMYGLPTVGM